MAVGSSFVMETVSENLWYSVLGIYSCFVELISSMCVVDDVSIEAGWKIPFLMVVDSSNEW